MPKIAYEEKRISDRLLAMIVIANRIIGEYIEAGYRLTLRQLYYQFVARGLFPDDRRWTWTGTKWKKDPEGTKNADPNYKWLGSLINNGRLAGFIDWTAIEDRTRAMKENSHWNSPADIVDSAATSYGIDLWEGQSKRVEVWVEKEALAGVVERPSSKIDVPWFCCRGYVSQSAMWRAAMRLCAWERRGAETVVIHLGDHDPSGVDMSRDIEDRLHLFGANTTVERIALNMDQIEELNPPSDPAKLSDSRAADYIAQYGDESWELDALDPAYLDNLISQAVEVHVDRDMYEDRIERQEEERERLEKVAEDFRESDEVESED